MKTDQSSPLYNTFCSLLPWRSSNFSIYGQSRLGCLYLTISLSLLPGLNLTTLEALILIFLPV